jgi:hypothetical protein
MVVSLVNVASTQYDCFKIKKKQAIWLSLVF